MAGDGPLDDESQSVVAQVDVVQRAAESSIFEDCRRPNTDDFRWSS